VGHVERAEGGDQLHHAATTDSAIAVSREFEAAEPECAMALRARQICRSVVLLAARSRERSPRTRARLERVEAGAGHNARRYVISRSLSQFASSWDNSPYPTSSDAWFVITVPLYATPFAGFSMGSRVAAATSSLAGGSGASGPPDTGVSHTCIIGEVVRFELPTAQVPVALLPTTLAPLKHRSVWMCH
jgi:hypothetical protein